MNGRFISATLCLLAARQRVCLNRNVYFDISTVSEDGDRYDYRYRYRCFQSMRHHRSCVAARPRRDLGGALRHLPVTPIATSPAAMQLGSLNNPRCVPRRQLFMVYFLSIALAFVLLSIRFEDLIYYRDQSLQTGIARFFCSLKLFVNKLFWIMCLSVTRYNR